MKLIRWVLGKFILAYEKIASPKGIVREPTVQAMIDQKTQNFELYQFKACPFCVKVRLVLKKQSLNVNILDAKNNQTHRETLKQKGGRIKVPCLRIKSDCGSKDEWLYESDNIIRYLEQKVVNA